jgi:hypothetical protein
MDTADTKAEEEKGCLLVTIALLARYIHVDGNLNTGIREQSTKDFVM